MLTIILKKNISRESFNLNVCANFSCVNDNCAITEETKFCKDERKHINDIPNCFYNKVVDPKNPQCIDFCVKTYTRKDGTRDIQQQRLVEQEFVEEKKHEYFASKCNECIDNYYDNITQLL